MISNKLFVFGVFLCLLSLALATGKQGYGDQCSVIGGLGNLFRSDENDDAKACNSDKKLVCTGTCVCMPGYVYEKGLFGVFTGGKCYLAANLPCNAKETDCVANSLCTGETVSLCKCNDGYHTKDGHCTSGSGQNFLNVMYIVTLLSSYFLLAR